MLDESPVIGSAKRALIFNFKPHRRHDIEIRSGNSIRI